MSMDVIVQKISIGDLVSFLESTEPSVHTLRLFLAVSDLVKTDSLDKYLETNYSEVGDTSRELFELQYRLQKLAIRY